MNGLYGSAVTDPNFKLRFCLIVFVGVISAAVALSWKSQILLASEYQDLPVMHEQLKVKKENLVKQKGLQRTLIQKEIQAKL